MSEFGNTLKAARERKNYTVSQVAELTNIMYSAIEDLEKEDTTHVAAPIYGRGFVKLYCELVGLEPAPMIAAYMELYNQQHNIQVEQPDLPLDEPPPATTPKFGTDDETTAINETGDAQPPVGGELSRYASPFRDKLGEARDFQRRYWRLAIVVVVAILVMWGLFAGLKALYRATTETVPSPNKTAAAAITTPAKAEPAKTALAKATSGKTTAPNKPTKKVAHEPIKVAPLYID